MASITSDSEREPLLERRRGWWSSLCCWRGLFTAMWNREPPPLLVPAPPVPMMVPLQPLRQDRRMEFLRGPPDPERPRLNKRSRRALEERRRRRRRSERRGLLSPDYEEP